MHRTRKEALAAGADQYFTGKPCPHGHISMRRVSGACCGCSAITSSAYQKVNKERFKEWKLASQKRNRASANERQRRYREANTERTRAATSAWAKANPGKCAAKWARYHADKLQRTPAWADAEAIDGMYWLCGVFRSVGLDLHVDHVIPLRGKAVSGLHVPDNLQLVHSSANRAKSNRFAT